jgi:hypothetical protein
VDWNHLIIDAGFCENKNEHSGSMNAGNLLAGKFTAFLRGTVLNTVIAV